MNKWLCMFGVFKTGVCDFINSIDSPNKNQQIGSGFTHKVKLFFNCHSQ